jgi:hypothetical protein
MVDRSKTYATVAASQSAPPKKHLISVTKKPDTSQPPIFRGVLTTAIDNQQVILTKVTLPEAEMERHKVLTVAAYNQ